MENKTPIMTNTQLPKGILDKIESEARNYAWRNYVTTSLHPNAEYDNINTWPDEACYGYYSIKYYLSANGPAQPEPGIFSAIQLQTLQQDNQRLREALNRSAGVWVKANEKLPEIGLPESLKGKVKRSILSKCVYSDSCVIGYDASTMYCEGHNDDIYISFTDLEWLDETKALTEPVNPEA